MSFFDDASLVMIPSGYKASKVYSVKPTDGTGDLTFTRALDTATRVGPDGLIEKVRTNLVLQSQTFDNAGWSKTNTTIVANAETAPDGTLTAETMTIADGASRIDQSLSLGAGTYTISCFVKVISTTTAGTLRFSPTIDGSSQNAFFTPTSDYQRFSATFTAATGLTLARFRGVTAEFVGTIAIWGFQVELSDFGPTDYIPTTTAAVSVGMLANVPRLDYLGGGCPKLLLESQRTNLMTFSEQFNNDDWEKTGTTISANVATSPDGFTDADKIVGDASAGDKLASQLKFITVAQAFTISAFFKKSEYKLAFVRAGGQTGSPYVIYNLDTEAVVQTSGASSTKIEDYGNGWYRVSLTLNSATTGTCAPNIIFLPDSGFTLTGLNVPQYTGDGTSGGFVWGCQLEANGGSFATSYIPTLGAAVTRSADAASKTGISALIGQTEGTLFAEFTYNGVANSGVYEIILELATDANNVITINKNNITSELYVFSRVGGVIQVNSVGIAGTNILGTHKVALAYNLNDYVCFLDGVQVFTDTSATVPTCSAVFVGDGISGTQQLGGGIAQTLLFKTRLTNAQLAELTA